jgi:hypothetical protein
MGRVRTEAPAVLPTIPLDLRRLVAGPLNAPRAETERPQGETHTYNRERLAAAAAEQGLAVDDFIAWHAAGGLRPNRPGSPVLIFYGLTSEHVQLTVCGPWVGAALTRVPGRMESGRGRALPNAQPLLYWDGRQLRRVYAPPAAAPAGALVDDLGTVVGRAVGPADEEAARRLAAGEAPDPWRPPVPDTPEREVVVGGEGRRIAYAWWKAK